MKEKIGHEVTLVGTAAEAKGGPVVVFPAGDPVYVKDLPEWPEPVEGKQVRVTGVLGWEQFIPEVRVDPNGAISQGAVGKQYTLASARWKIVE